MLVAGGPPSAAGRLRPGPLGKGAPFFRTVMAVRANFYGADGPPDAFAIAAN